MIISIALTLIVLANLGITLSGDLNIAQAIFSIVLSVLVISASIYNVKKGSKA